MRQRLVVIGNGMAGARVVEEILKRAPNRFDITMFGAEPYGNYNRILLSNVLNGTQPAEDIFMNPLSWYQENRITLHAGVKATKIDRDRRVVVGQPMRKDAAAYGTHGWDTDAAPIEVRYDNVIVATGARPWVPPIQNFDGPGSYVFRTIDDCDQMADFAKGCRRAAVIGGGLLGLEAARGLLTHDVEVTVLEAAPQLMMAQLDQESGDMLRATIEAMGIKVVTKAITTKVVRDGVADGDGRKHADGGWEGQVDARQNGNGKGKGNGNGHGGGKGQGQEQGHGNGHGQGHGHGAVHGDGRITHLELRDGTRVETDMVVVSTGIRPISEIAVASGLKVDKGILCDDQMRTSDPNIFALGECVEHRGQTYGLVDPIWEMADVLADVITGTNPEAAYLGSKLGTKLKVMGVQLASMGETETNSPSDEVVVFREPRKGIYKKIVVRENRLAGAILLGDVDSASTLMQMFLGGSKVPDRRADLFFGSPTGVSLLKVSDLPDNAQICNCNGVSKKKIVEAIETQQCQSVFKVGACTKAGVGCGSCKSLIAQLLEETVGEVGYDPTEHYYVPGVPLEKSQLVAEIKRRGLKSVSAVFHALAGGREDPGSKAGLASLLKTLWPDEYTDERDARFINDRVHANIQKDGTFSVIPRIYAGVTTPAELMRIAEVAVKYDVPMVKITGGQRIDLLGVKKEDLPDVWRDLDMPSGHAYTKSMRTCKSCVGTDFCRYGVGDSIALAQKIERRFQGIESPHKMKLATAGCPRNCSEAYVKDLGAVAIDGGKWEIYIGGAAGGSVRKGDKLVTVDSHEEVLATMGRFIQYYREHGRYLERTYDFVERIGIDNLRQILIEDSLGISARLEADIQKAVDAYVDPWKEAEQPAYPEQFLGPELATTLAMAESNG